MDEGRRVVGVRGQPRLRVQCDSNRSDCRQSTIAAGRGQLSAVVDAGEYLGEEIGLEAVSIEQVVLEQLTRLVRLGKYLQRQIRVRSIRQSDQLILERLRQLHDVSTVGNGVAVCGCVRIRMAGRRGLLRVGVGDTTQRNAYCGAP